MNERWKHIQLLHTTYLYLYLYRPSSCWRFSRRDFFVRPRDFFVRPPEEEEADEEEPSNIASASRLFLTRVAGTATEEAGGEKEREGEKENLQRSLVAIDQWTVITKNSHYSLEEEEEEAFNAAAVRAL